MMNPMTEALAQDLATRLPAAAIREVEPRYLEEPRGQWAGQAACVVAPATAEEVAEVIRFAGAHGVPVVPYGGGTGLVGGQVSPDGAAPILLSLERMSAIRAVHPREAVLVAEAGAILADVQAAAEEAALLFPLSLASEGSARIGGLLATNAGGVNVLRYGNARELCLGLEAVLPDGSIWHGLRRLRKDNTGYDLRHLLIGAEGTLGVITAASLRLFPRPERRAAAFMVVRDPGAALDLLAMARRRLGEGVSAFELISGMGLEFLRETERPVRRPFDPSPDWLVLVELGLPAALDSEAALEELFAEALEAELVDDGLIAQSEQQRAEFWAVRETIPEANKHVGAIASHDISLPLSAIPDFIARADAALAKLGDFRINCFGHLGDGNLHYNVFPAHGRSKTEYGEARREVSALVHDMVHEMEGSFSAEHGVGRLKVGELERYGDPAKLAAMRAIKAALDPSGIMNPGAVLRAPE